MVSGRAWLAGCSPGLRGKSGLRPVAAAEISELHRSIRPRMPSPSREAPQIRSLAPKAVFPPAMLR